MFVAYDSVALGKSREYIKEFLMRIGHHQSQATRRQHDGCQDIFETREKCMIKIHVPPAHDINLYFSALFINSGYTMDSM